MSARELSSVTTTNDSNIPKLKKTPGGVRKSKVSSKLPELQKYIETIIKATNETDSENTSLSQKEKFPKERQFGKRVVCKGLENKFKLEKRKLDVVSNRCKNKRETSKKCSEAVSRGLGVLHKFFSEFEDPRNWNIRNSVSRLKIKKLIQKYYPNPYTIRCENEYQNSETRIIGENFNNDDLEYETSYNVFISKVDAETQDDLDNTNFDLVSADFQIMLSEREENSTKVDMAVSPENLKQSLTPNKINHVELKQSKDSVVSKLNTTAHSPNKSHNISHSSSVSNSDSRASSVVSVNLRKENQINYIKERKLKANAEVSSREICPKIQNTLSKKILTDAKESDNDCNSGKLNLLNVPDSDRLTFNNFDLKNSEIENTNNIATDDFVNEISSEICNEISKTNDLNDLLRIYEVMNKATESFLYLTSMKKSAFGNKKSAKVLDNSLNKDPDFQSSENIKSLKMKNSDSSINENSLNANEDKAISNISDSLVKNKPKSREEKQEIPITKNSSQNILDINTKNRAEKEVFNSETKSEPESEKTDFFDNEEDIERILNLNDCEEKDENTDDEMFDANQKINEVLHIMNECLLKLSNNEKIFHQEMENYKKHPEKANSSENFSKATEENKPNSALIPKTSSDDFIDQSLMESLSESSVLNECPEAQKNQSEVLDIMSKNQNTRIRCRRKSKIPTSTLREKMANASSQQLSGNETEASSSNVDEQIPPNADSVQISNENVIQAAEVQNELGGCTEESQETTIILNRNSQHLKNSVLPISTKPKRCQPATYQTLKYALETEEKLLKLHKSVPRKIFICNSQSQFIIRNDSIIGYSSADELERMNSNFVFCITPFIQNLRKTGVITPRLSIPKPLSVSLIDFRSWNLKPLPQKYSAEKLFIPSQIKYRALKFRYKFTLERQSIISTTRVIYCARPVCYTSLMSFPKVQEEFSLEYSKSQIKVKPLKKFSIMNLNTAGSSGFCIRNTVTFTTSKHNLLNNSKSETNMNIYNQPMEALIKAIEETENVFLLQQYKDSENNSLGHFESFCSCDSSKMLRAKAFDHELEKETDKEKVQDLLLRTYKLQNKLQQHLYNISHVQPKRSLSSLIKQDLTVTAREKTPPSDVCPTNININPEKSSSSIQMSLRLSETKKETKIDQAVAVNVLMVDRSTTYFPPSEEESEIICEKADDLNYNMNNFPDSKKEEETLLNSENEDDRSSTSSFKSSNDFSETNEIQNFMHESSYHMTNKDVFNRIFSQIELIKQSVDAEKLEREEKKFFNNMNSKQEEDIKDNKLIEFDPKTPSKVLKTVFKGIKSSTELTIGLKDVPMTKVSNISVEKTKFSPNHTKISICISKENADEINISNHAESKLVSKKVSSCFTDQIRPSLSMCHTEYSRIQDNISKSSPSLNERSDDDDDDDDEDDFKSVESTIIINSTANSEIEKSKTQSQEVFEKSRSKNFTKHKFDFYRKMDMNAEGLKVRSKPVSNPLCKFKELEPLKHALTELQIRMRSIKREAVLNSNDYYERALKLAKMSAGYCQSCGTRAVIPDDTFGYYKALLPKPHSQHRRHRQFKSTLTPNSSFYSFRSSNAEVSGQFCDLDVKGGSTFSLNQTTHSKRTILRSSLHDMPALFEDI